MFRRTLHYPYKPLGGWMLRQAQAVIAVSNVERMLLQRHFGRFIASAVILNGVDIGDFLSAQSRFSESGTKLVLSAGRLESYKQVDRVVEAVRYLPPGYSLTIIGEGKERGRIERRAASLGVQEKLRLLSHVPRQELAAWYRSADVFVNMSRNEAFGLAVLESAVAGARIVASDIPAHREVSTLLPEGSIFFSRPDCSPAELGATIVAAAEVGRHHEHWDTRGVPSWKAMVESVLACYERILTHREPVENSGVLSPTYLSGTKD